MYRANYLVNYLIVAVALLSSSAIAQGEASWQAGVAAVNITPESPIWMAGYASRDKPATGTLTELWAKALVLEDGASHRSVLITLDLVGIDRDISQTICRRLRQEHQLEREQIAICVSHTHTGPVVGKNLRPMHYERLNADQQTAVRAYADTLVQHVIDAVDEAADNLVEVSLESGHGRATFAVNRRNNPEPEVPARREAGTLVGPVDHDVPVLTVKRDDQSVMAVVFGYACHATVLSSFEWSGDYPGFAQLRLQQELPGATALFWAGCGADQNPLPRRQVELARDYGDALANAVLETVHGDMRPVAPTLETWYREIDLPLDVLPTAEQLEQDTENKNRYVAARARMLLRQIQQGEPLAKTYPYPISCWQLGDSIRWYHLGGEVVVDYALKIKSLESSRDTWVAGYSHDVMAYIPSQRVWHEGGYEGATAMIYYGLPTRWAESVEDVIMDAVGK